MTIRINRLAVALLGVLGLLACLAGRPTQARPLPDRTLALILGSNGPQKGSGSYGCADAAVTSNPNKYTTSTSCSQLTSANASGKTCVSCNGPSTTSFSSDQNGTPLTSQNQTVNCSQSPTTGQPTQLSNQGTCMATPAGAMASCQNHPANQNLGVCPAGNFTVYLQQQVQPAILNPQ